jgi:hypothetical protein
MTQINGGIIEDLTPRLQSLIMHTMMHCYTHHDSGESCLVGAIGVKIDDLFYLLSMAAMAEQKTKRVEQA